jgi:divalent metal cation (Fe/Co/Zn/Cd) transporter
MVEAVVGLLAGLLASSIALKAFGLDSVIETFSGAILLWRLKQRGLDEARAESRAIRLVSLTFFALAAYVAAEALADLWFRRAPQFSLLGMILASCSLLVMPALGVAKRQIAVLLKSSALSADGLRTLLCAYLSATLLIGLALNGWLGWWWADPTAALAMTGFMIWEGIETFSKKPSQA